MIRQQSYPQSLKLFLLLMEFVTSMVFAATSERVHEEWLLAYPKGRPQRWFTRIWNEELNIYDWDMGNSFSGQKQVWQDSTRSNALFLSTAVNLNSEQLQPVFDWFNNNLRALSIGGDYPEFTASLCKDSNERKKVLKYLKVADLGISDISVESERISAKHLPDDMPDELKSLLLKNAKHAEVFDIQAIHRTNQGKTVSFDFDVEVSRNTEILRSNWPYS